MCIQVLFAIIPGKVRAELPAHQTDSSVQDGVNVWELTHDWRRCHQALLLLCVVFSGQTMSRFHCTHRTSPHMWACNLVKTVAGKTRQAHQLNKTESCQRVVVLGGSVDWTVSADQFQSTLSFLYSSFSIQTLTLSIPSLFVWGLNLPLSPLLPDTPHPLPPFPK